MDSIILLGETLETFEEGDWARIKGARTLVQITWFEEGETFAGCSKFGRKWRDYDEYTTNLEKISDEEVQIILEERKHKIALADTLLSEVSEKLNAMHKDAIEFDITMEEVDGRVALYSLQENGWLPSRFC